MNDDDLAPTEIVSETSGPQGPNPARIGSYRVLQAIGEGAMGVVYEAEQTEPVRRRVAIKVLKTGMDTREIVARFEAESQALAVMDHPGIARVLEAGAGDTGRPYFVMELVRGVPLTAYCDTGRLGIRSRVELFARICDAVQHAHMKGVVHRDLKPSNVLVTEADGRPVPKIIDFGIAKATGQRLTERTLVTALGQTMGTPVYMSPEQAEMSGLDVDTRTDIYSLGVMLYELLAGRPPLDPRDIGFPAFIAQLVTRETDPPTPSAKLSGLGEQRTAIALRRATEHRVLQRQLRGDLDWIVMKAMEKDRRRRYETASGMALDLRRHLAHEPVAARPPSTSYRIRKFVRRHTTGVAFAAIVAALVISFATVMAVQSRVIAHERDRARQEAAKARAVNEFMEETILAPDPVEGLGREVTVAEALESTAARLDTAIRDQPEVEASARNAVGWAFFRLGRYDEAEPLLRDALDLRRKWLGPTHAELAESLDRWGQLRAVRADFESAESFLRQGLRMRRKVLGPNHPDVTASLGTLGTLLGELGRYEDAELVIHEALDTVGDDEERSLETIDLENKLGVLLWNQGRYEELEPLWRRMLDKRRQRLGEQHPLVGESLNNLAVLYDSTDRASEAEVFYRQALAIQLNALGPDHEEVGAAMANLAILLETRGEVGEAEELYREALRIDRGQLGNGHPAVAGDLVNLASLLCESGRPAEGLSLIDAAIVAFEESLETGHWRIANTRHWRGRCLARLGRYREGERELLAGLESLAGALGEEHPRVARVRERLIELYADWGKPERADALRSRTGDNAAG